MKIVYAAEDRLGAAHQLSAFMTHTTHETKIAAYPKSGRLSKHIDWNLNASQSYQVLRKDIERYYPDLFLIDCEPVVADIAHQLDIPIIYCSSLHLLDGLRWPRINRGYSTTLEKTRAKINKLPLGVIRFIYSPFGDLLDPLDLKNGFEWIQPYHSVVKNNRQDIFLSMIEDPARKQNIDAIVRYSKLHIISEQISNKSYLENLSKASGILTEGATQFVADAIYNDKKICSIPKIEDPENLLNSILCFYYHLGTDLGQIELVGHSALEAIEEMLSTTSKKNIIVKKHKKLHERINELWDCT